MTSYGRIVQVTSRFTGTSSVGVEAVGQTVISVDNVQTFLTDMGFVTVGDAGVEPYVAVDRNTSTITLSSPLEEALPAGTEIKQFPFSVQRWALIEPDSTGEEPVDAVWAVIPHALAGFVANDGLRDEEDRERVKYARDGGLFLVSDVIDKQPYLNPIAIPEGAITETNIQPGAITTPLLAANAVAAANIQAGAVQATAIATDALDGKVITGAIIRTAAEGKRLELMESGLIQLDSAGNVILSIGDTNSFTGDVDATSMIIRDSLQLFGRNNLFGVGSKVTLKASVGAPGNPATMSWDYEQFTAVDVNPGGFYFTTTGLQTDSTGGTRHASELFLGQSRLWAGSNYYQWPYVGSTGQPGYKIYSMTRIAKGDNNALRTVTIGEDYAVPGAGGYPRIVVGVWDTSPMNSSGTVSPTYKGGQYLWLWTLNRNYKVVRCINGGSWKNLFAVIETVSSGSGPQTVNYHIYRFENDDTTVTHLSSNTMGAILPEGETIAGGAYGNSASLGVDGTNRQIVVLQTDKGNYVWNHDTLSREPSNDWPTTYNQQWRTYVSGDIATNTFGHFCSWNGASGADQKVFKYANNHKTAAATLWGSYVWRGEASQSFRTTMSAPAAIAYRKRARLKVSVPALPAPIAGVGAARDPAKDVYGWVYFLGTGGAPPARTAMFEQAVQPGMAADTPMAVSSIELSTYPVFSGTNPPAASTFPAASAATIESDNGLLKITGDGDELVRDLTVSREFSAPVANNAIRGVLHSNQPIATATWTTLSNWNTLDYIGVSEVGINWAGGGVWVLNNGGYYVFDLRATFVAAAGRLRAVRLRVGSTTAIQTNTPAITTVDWTTAQLHWEGRVAAGTQVQFQAYQDSGGSLNVITVDGSTGYSIRRITV